jgi:hypothetical protein
MLKRFRNNNGQAISAELVVTFILVVAAVLALSTYVRRTLQARTRDAMVYTRGEAATALQDNITLQYEPYYVQVESNITQSSSDTSNIVSGGDLIRNVSQRKAMTSTSSQLAPKEKD